MTTIGERNTNLRHQLPLVSSATNSVNDYTKLGVGSEAAPYRRGSRGKRRIVVAGRALKDRLNVNEIRRNVDLKSNIVMIIAVAGTISLMMAQFLCASAAVAAAARQRQATLNNHEHQRQLVQTLQSPSEAHSQTMPNYQHVTPTRHTTKLQHSHHQPVEARDLMAQMSHLSHHETDYGSDGGSSSGGSSISLPDATSVAMDEFASSAARLTPLQEANKEADDGDSTALADQQHNQNHSDHDDESAENTQEAPERNLFMSQHNSQLRAMHDLFERRQLNSNSNNNRPLNGHHHHHQPLHNHQLQSSQELSPISIGLDGPVAPPFSMAPFAEGPPPPQLKPEMANADQGLGPGLPFGLNPLPHLLGFQNSAFEGPQRGDQSAHSNHHAQAPPIPVADPEVVGGGATGNPKVWPKIFRFTDGRINLSDFEKQKKIRLSNKNQHQTDNHIESAPIMFDGRQLKRKSFLILHGGIFSK